MPNLVLETNFQNTIGLVNDKRLEVLEDEWGVHEVIEETTRSSNQKIDTLGQLLRLGSPVRTANDNAVGLRVELHQFACDAKDLQGKFAGRRDDDDTGAVARLKSEGAEDFDGGEEEGEGLSGACLCGTEDILASKQRWNSLLFLSVCNGGEYDRCHGSTYGALNGRHLCETHLVDRLHGPL